MVEKFLKEAVVLKNFKHANVLETLAVSFPALHTPQVVFPYMANGDLKSLLKRKPSVRTMLLMIKLKNIDLKF